jgi:DNA-binding NarL/FixJ family response regulator
MELRVLLADDHSIVRDGIRSIVENEYKNAHIVAEASDGREVLKIAETTPIDLYIIDIGMPGLNGVETIERLKKLHPKCKIIVLSMYSDKVLVEKTMQKGAMAYVMKDSSSKEILNAISEVQKGQYYLSPGAAGHIVKGFLRGGMPENPDQLESKLTSRQREILQLICEGLTEKDIAEKLFISPHTVHVHKNNIMKSLDIHTKAGLVKYSIRTGIVQI